MTTGELSKDPRTSLLDRDNHFVTSNHAQSLLRGKFSSLRIVTQLIRLPADARIETSCLLYPLGGLLDRGPRFPQLCAFAQVGGDGQRGDGQDNDHQPGKGGDQADLITRPDQKLSPMVDADNRFSCVRIDYLFQAIPPDLSLNGFQRNTGQRVLYRTSAGAARNHHQRYT